MTLLNLQEQREIVKVIEYLVAIHQKNNTVEDVMERFGLSYEQYSMCCNLAMPALRQGNMKGRFTAVSKTNKAMRKELKALYERVKDDGGLAAAGVREMYRNWCVKPQNVVYGKQEDNEE